VRFLRAFRGADKRAPYWWGLIFAATVLYLRITGSLASWESPICSRHGIRREIRYRAAPGFFSADTKARCDRRRIPAKLLPTDNSRILRRRCRTRARRTLEIGIVERCQEEAGDEIGPTTRTGGGTLRMRHREKDAARGVQAILVWDRSEKNALGIPWCSIAH